MTTIWYYSKHLFCTSVICLSPTLAFPETFTTQNKLYETPVVTTQPQNTLTFGYTYGTDKRDLFFDFQASDRLRVGLSFPKFEDEGGSVSGNDINIAYTVVQESTVMPAISVGLTGLGSEGRGTGEYIAATKLVGDFQGTVGLGWGRFAGLNASRGDETGPFTYDHLFQGDAEPFGSLIWDAPVTGLTLGVEYGATRKADNSAFVGFRTGATYTTARGLSYSGFVDEEGTYGFQLSLAINPNVPYTLPNNENPPALMNGGQIPPASDAVLLARLQESFGEAGINLIRLSTSGNTISVTVRASNDRNFARVTGRTARILSMTAPSRYKRFAITQTAGSFDTNTIVLNRGMLARSVDRTDGARRVLDRASIQSTPRAQGPAIYESTFTPSRNFDITPRFSFDIQSTDELKLVGELTGSASYSISPNTRLRTQLGYRFLNQWDQADAPDTPEIRSDNSSYTPDIIFLKSATIAHRGKLSDDVYARVSAGLFERMYGGVSAEAVWRDPERNFSLGLEAAYVQKRAYDNWFGFEDLTASTLIGSVHANFGDQGDFAIVDAGQYLAGDFGVSLTVGRDFSNGWRVAAFTKWSDELEDTMQYGVSLDIPLDWAIPGRGTDNIGVRIGGGGTGDLVSRVGGTDRLAGTLRASDPQRLRDGWGEFWD